MRNRKSRAAAPAAAVLGLSLIAAGGIAVEANADKSSRAAAMHALEGVWVVTVDPAATPAGDPPPFESTLAYDEAHVVNEITSRMDGVSAGLGSWRRTGPESFATTWHKYRFDSSGTYIGKTVIREAITMQGADSYIAHAVTSVVNPAGGVVASFETEAVGNRM